MKFANAFAGVAAKARTALLKKPSGKSSSGLETSKEEEGRVEPAEAKLYKDSVSAGRFTAISAVTTPPVVVETISVPGESSSCSSRSSSIVSVSLADEPNACTQGSQVAATDPEAPADGTEHDEVQQQANADVGEQAQQAVSAAQSKQQQQQSAGQPAATGSQPTTKGLTQSVVDEGGLSQSKAYGKQGVQQAKPVVSLSSEASVRPAGHKAPSAAVPAKAPNDVAAKPRAAAAAGSKAATSRLAARASFGSAAKPVAKGAQQQPNARVTASSSSAAGKPPTAARRAPSPGPSTRIPVTRSPTAAEKGKRPLVVEQPGKQDIKGVVTTGRTGKAPTCIEVTSRSNYDGSPPSTSSGYSTPCSANSRRSSASGGSKASSAASVAEELVAHLKQAHSRGPSDASLPDLKQLLERVDTWAAGHGELDLPKVRVPKMATTASGERVRDSARSSLMSARSSCSSIPVRPAERQAAGVDTQTLSTLAKLAEVQNLLSARGGAAGGGGSAKVLARAVRQLCSADPGRRQAGITKVVGLFGEEYGLLIATVVLLVAQLQC